MIVLKKDIIGIFDLDVTSQSKRTRQYLERCEKKGKTVMVGADIPKSFVVCGAGERERVYLTQIASATLMKRFALPV